MVSRVGAIATAALLVVVGFVAANSGDEDVPRRAPDISREAPGGERRRPAIERRPFTPARGDVQRDAKRVAGRVAERLTTYERGTSADQLARRVAGPGARARRLATAARPLVRADARSTGTVVYPQLGGLTTSTASVMVVVRQRTGAPEVEPAVVTRTLDIRLRRSGGVWALDRLASAGGDPVPRPSELSRVAQAVLDNRRIELSDSARWDIHRGGVDDRLLAAMGAAARRTRYRVAVIDSGHPRNVFGTDRRSAHASGYAVDIYAVEDRLVVAQRRARGPAYAFTRRLYARAPYQLGSPWVFSGAGSTFTDEVHQDHIHLQQSVVPGAIGERPSVGSGA